MYFPSVSSLPAAHVLQQPGLSVANVDNQGFRLVHPCRSRARVLESSLLPTGIHISTRSDKAELLGLKLGTPPWDARLPRGSLPTALRDLFNCEISCFCL